MTFLEIANRLLIAFAFVALYFFLGFGPGFLLGLSLANKIFGRQKPLLMDTHIEAKKLAAQHNAQWHPSHPRWRE